MKEYAIEQRRFNEKVFGRGTRSIDSVEGLLNKYAKEGWMDVKLPENDPFPLRQFIDSVLYGAPVNFGLEEGRQLTELMENAYIADREHRDVQF